VTIVKHCDKVGRCVDLLATSVVICCGQMYSLLLAKVTDGAREKLEVGGTVVQLQDVYFMIPGGVLHSPSQVGVL